MTTFLLVGHGGFYNRGCEAIVRTTTALIRERFKDARIILASHSQAEDRMHEAADGLEIIPHRAPHLSVPWVFGALANRVLRNYTLASELLCPNLWPAVQDADAVLSIGGDNYAMSPGFPRTITGINEAIHKRQRPLIIWGASIGPFPTGPLEDAAMDSVRKAALITARETITEEYLHRNGVTENVRLVADPAFLLPVEPVETKAFWPEGDGVLGLNVSPLLKRYRSDGTDTPILQAAEQVIHHAVDSGLGVLLIPHVIDSYNSNNDHQFMANLLAGAHQYGNRVRLMPNNLDACQTKYVISQCRFLVAARTHATIAGFSTGVPTVSLAYSQKALGINQDIFGHQDWVVDSRSLKAPDALLATIRRLVENEDDVRRLIEGQGDVMREKARLGVEYLAAAMVA